MGWAMVLMLLVLYTTSIVTTKLFGRGSSKNNEEVEKYFGSMVRSMFTLFQIVTLEGWNIVARTMMDEIGFWVCIFFILFLMFTNFVLMSLVTGVIVDNILTISSEVECYQVEHMERARIQAVHALDNSFREADLNNDGVLLLNQFRETLRGDSNSSIVVELEKLDMSIWDAEELFLVLDHGHRGSLSIEEYVRGCVEASGAATAKQMLVLQSGSHNMWSFVNESSEKSLDVLANIEKRLANIEKFVENNFTSSTQSEDSISRIENLLQSLGINLDPHENHPDEPLTSSL